MQERDYIYPVEVDMLMRGADGEITPVGYERMIMDSIEKHFAINRRDDSEGELLKKGVAWVIISTSIEIKSRISPGEKLYARTWEVEKKGLVFRREVGIYHEDGTLAAGAATFFVIIDTEKRSMVRNPENYVSCVAANGEKLTEGESRIKFKAEGFETVEELTVRPSWIDAVGHVNNVRYLEMAYDALTDAERDNISKLKRLEAYFINELHKGEKIAFSRKSGEDCTSVAVSKPGESKPAFVAKLFFE